MAAPVVESSSTYTATSVASIVNTKPTGLAVGDYMVHYCVYTDGTVNTYTTPSGWTSLGQVDSVNGARKHAVFGKIADSSDVAASNFTVSINATCDVVLGILLRISNFGKVDSIELDANAPSSTTVSFTGASTPDFADTLALMSICCRTGASLATVSGYTSTPSNTWTEVQDIGQAGGGDFLTMAVASAAPSSLSEITAYGATLSVSMQYHFGSLLLLTPVRNETGTNALLSVSPTLFSQNGVAGTTGTNALLEASPTHFDQSGRGETPTNWSAESKPSTTWTKESI